MTELKACPFCGARAAYYDTQIDFVEHSGVSCRECGVDMQPFEHETKDEVATRWNRRI